MQNQDRVVNIPVDWLRRRVRVALIGVGGNGSQMLTALARIDASWRALGHPWGLDVMVYDPDVVTEANIGRQLFASSDIGQNKAMVIVSRINNFYGLRWQGKPEAFTLGGWGYDVDMIITCTDTKASRLEVHQHMRKHARGNQYWMDLGNDMSAGQVIIGSSARVKKMATPEFYLPDVVDLLPKVFGIKKEDNQPSCSLAAALMRQDLFINQHVVTWAATLLWTWLKTGQLKVHGYFVNCETGRSSPLPIDTEVWKRMGFELRACPLRKIVKVVEVSKSRFNKNVVKLSCGHIERSNATQRARCATCHQRGNFE